MKEESKDILTKLLESILDIRIEDTSFLNLERNVDNIHVRRKHFDLFLQTNIVKIQVEVNAEKPNYLHPRNASFIFDTYSHEVKKKEEYNEDTLVIQINLSYHLNIEELKELEKLSQDRSVDKYMKTIEEVNEEPEFREFMSAEEDNRKIENSLRREAIEKGLAEGLEKGLSQGIEQGSTEKAIEIAKAMLDKGMDINLISELTNLSIEEINSLKTF